MHNSPHNRTNNLPVQPNPLVGRQAELAQITGWLAGGAARLVTLTGIGGAGKTRLALQAAADLLNAFPDGVYFVTLDQLFDPSLAPDAIAQAISLELTGNQETSTALINYLRPRAILLVLDNFEHLMPATNLVSQLLNTCPFLKLLVTSRELLRLRGEHELPLSPLPLPDTDRRLSPDQLAQVDAVALFLQRAQAARPDFQLDAANAPAIAEICAVLDGLPLAIELAAARLRMFSPQALLARLKNQPVARLLASGPRDLPPRQQTLQNTLEWSYALLSPAEQALFRRLGVFSGGFTLEAIEPVCFMPGDPVIDGLELLTSLVEKSLVRPMEQPEGQVRFTQLSLLRQFALEKLEQVGESPAFQQKQAEYFAALVEQAEPELSKNDQACWYGMLAVEHDNLRAALHWATGNQQTELGLRLVASLYRFWIHRNHLQEGYRWSEQALALPGSQAAPPALRARALLSASAMADFLANYPRALALLEARLEVLHSLEDLPGIARTVSNIGYLKIMLGEDQAGSQLLQESIGIFRQIDDHRGLLVSLNKLAIFAMDQGNLAWARELLQESLALAQAKADQEGIAMTTSNLGLVAYYQGEYARARENLEESRRIHNSLRQEIHANEALEWIGYTRLHEGNLQAARANFEQTLRFSQQAGDRMGMVYSLEGLAGVAARREQSQRAAQLFGAAEALRETIKLPMPPSERRMNTPLIDAARSQLKKVGFERAWMAGRAMIEDSLDHTVAYALEPDTPEGKAARSGDQAGLTPREAEILRLLAQGLTDAQIAEKLVISPRTVNAHLTSVYGKLGVNSRAAATRYAIENEMA